MKNSNLVRVVFISSGHSAPGFPCPSLGTLAQFLPSILHWPTQWRKHCSSTQDSTQADGDLNRDRPVGILLRLNKGARERVCGMRPCPEVSCQGWKTGSSERRILEEAEGQTWTRVMTVPETLSHLSWVSGCPASWKGVKPVAGMA